MNRFFPEFAAAIPLRSDLRSRVTEHTRVPEDACVQNLAQDARLQPEQASLAKATARALIEALRKKPVSGIVQGLVQEYDLSTGEGVALMCLAEALLRIPDAATRDALIRDKLASGNWRGHIGKGTSIFVNAATWGLAVSGKVMSSRQSKHLPQILDKVLCRCGEPLIRRGVDMAMRLMGAQFVTGQTIDEALKNSRPFVARGFRYSYDMLGEAAMTAADAERYTRDYEAAIHAIGKASRGTGVYRGPGISIKLSALHPRYTRLQRDRVMAELLPRLTELARLARGYDIGFNIDAEEADRLELSLDLLEALCRDETLNGWKGIGFVVQAYQKRAPFVLDWVIDLARRTGHRLMVRLVKGAYWDSEIKKAQVDGLSDFPVFTRKIHTDISYIACAKKLLGAPDAIFPQFATHNAQTLASIHALAGPDFTDESYEFQCLHGMGENLYSEVVGPEKLNRPVRVYAPVGTHETLLAYLVRRLLENGANSSFVNRIQDRTVTVEDLVAEPVTLLAKDIPNPVVRLPPDMFLPERRNSAGLDLANEHTLRTLGETLMRPLDLSDDTHGNASINPANTSDCVGHVSFMSRAELDLAIAEAADSFQTWSTCPASERAAMLNAAADALEDETPRLIGLIIREAGKTLANAVSEIREAIDFLRYYAAQIHALPQHDPMRPLGPVACISPWNFPLAIFLGQVGAALAAGNCVLAKPSEETPLIAREAVRILHEAGIPEAVLHLIPGDGAVGAQLTGDSRIRGVLFTGSNDVARLIQKQLTGRLNPKGRPVPFIAETGGQNALAADSSALSEQVVADVLSSAFDSAGQRCSALRVLCLQEDSADRVLTMLKDAMLELRTGNPERPETDVGPVISEEARRGIIAHIDAMRDQGYPTFQASLAPECKAGTFVPPTLIEIDNLHGLKKEVFGPVLHVLRYRRDQLPQLMADINNTGYGLTFGVHSRIDRTIEALAGASLAGNIYVNRNIVGAVVGVQPFSGHGLSGTGPKAGGPLYLRRLATELPGLPAGFRNPLPSPCDAFIAWSRQNLPAVAFPTPEHTPLGTTLHLPGPVGETNLYTLSSRGTVFCAGPTTSDLCTQIAAALATGNRCVVATAHFKTLASLPPELKKWVITDEITNPVAVDAILCNGDKTLRQAVGTEHKTHSRQIIVPQTPDSDGLYPLEWLLLERVLSTNTTAAGGNAALMTMV